MAVLVGAYFKWQVLFNVEPYTLVYAEFFHQIIYFYVADRVEIIYTVIAEVQSVVGSIIIDEFETIKFMGNSTIKDLTLEDDKPYENKTNILKSLTGFFKILGTSSLTY